MGRKSGFWTTMAILFVGLSVFCGGVCFGMSQGIKEVRTVWLDELDVSMAQEGWGKTMANKSVEGNPLTINGRVFERGVGTHAMGQFNIRLSKGSKRFTGLVGIDDEIAGSPNGRVTASVEFLIYGDNKVLWKSGEMKAKMDAKAFDVSLKGVKELRLMVSEGENGINYDHADWVDAKFEVLGAAPAAIEPVRPKPYILTPKPGPKPRITGAKVFGVRAGNPFLFTVTATGDRPMEFGAEGLPTGLVLDSSTGRITGAIEREGEYKETY